MKDKHHVFWLTVLALITIVTLTYSSAQSSADFKLFYKEEVEI